MKLLIICLLLMGCSNRGVDNVLNWHNMPESPQKEYCRKCSIDADVNDCNICAGYKKVPKKKN